MKGEDDKVDHVNEPPIGYGTPAKGRIAFFKSFEAAAEADREFYRNLTPEQRMAIHYELMVKTFGHPKESGGRFSF